MLQSREVSQVGVFYRNQPVFVLDDARPGHCGCVGYGHITSINEDGLMFVHTTEHLCPVGRTADELVPVPYIQAAWRYWQNQDWTSDVLLDYLDAAVPRVLEMIHDRRSYQARVGLALRYAGWDVVANGDVLEYVVPDYDNDWFRPLATVSSVHVQWTPHTTLCGQFLPGDIETYPWGDVEVECDRCAALFNDFDTMEFWRTNFVPRASEPLDTI